MLQFAVSQKMMQGVAELLAGLAIISVGGPAKTAIGAIASAVEAPSTEAIATRERCRFIVAPGSPELESVRTPFTVRLRANAVKVRRRYLSRTAFAGAKERLSNIARGPARRRTPAVVTWPLKEIGRALGKEQIAIHRLLVISDGYALADRRGSLRALFTG